MEYIETARKFLRYKWLSEKSDFVMDGNRASIPFWLLIQPDQNAENQETAATDDKSKKSDGKKDAPKSKEGSSKDTQGSISGSESTSTAS